MHYKQKNVTNNTFTNDNTTVITYWQNVCSVWKKKLLNHNLNIRIEQEGMFEMYLIMFSPWNIKLCGFLVHLAFQIFFQNYINYNRFCEERRRVIFWTLVVLKDSSSTLSIDLLSLGKGTESIAISFLILPLKGVGSALNLKCLTNYQPYKTWH